MRKELEHSPGFRMDISYTLSWQGDLCHIMNVRSNDVRATGGSILVTR